MNDGLLIIYVCPPKLPVWRGSTVFSRHQIIKSHLPDNWPKILLTIADK